MALLSDFFEYKGHSFVQVRLEYLKTRKSDIEAKGNHFSPYNKVRS